MAVVSGTYFCVSMALITLSSFLAVIVINTHIRGDRTNAVPRWLKRVNKHLTAQTPLVRFVVDLLLICCATCCRAYNKSTQIHIISNQWSSLRALEEKFTHAISVLF